MDRKLLTKRLAFLAMSDGALTMHKGCINASFAIVMKKSNKDFIDWCGSLLTELDVGWSYTAETDKYVGVRSRVHPFLTKLYNRIYPMGRKTPSPHDFKLLDWEAVAILYQCDGNIQRGGSRWYPMLNLCCFSYAELAWVKHQFKKILDLDVNIYKCGKYFRLGVPAKDSEMFFESVKPFMFPSFQYKLPCGRPQSMGDEIVRHSGQPERCAEMYTHEQIESC